MSNRSNTTKSYNPNNSKFYSDGKFVSFEVVDMGDNKVAVNKGVLTFGAKDLKSEDYIGDMKPQDTLGGEIDPTALLEVEEGDTVCIVVTDSTSDPIAAEIKALSEPELNSESGQIIKLARILAQEVAEPGDPALPDSDFLNIEKLYNGDICSVGGGDNTILWWTPIFFTETVGEIVQNKVKFKLGSVNNLLASNWADVFNIGATDTKYIILNVNGASDQGKITGYTISLDSEAPTEDNPTEEVLPAAFKIVLGVIKDLSAQMVITYNLNAYGREVFRKARAAPVNGGESFLRYWKWLVVKDNYN